MSEPKFTDKQEAFMSWYCRVLNATDAARRAGYEGDANTLRRMGSENLAKLDIRAEIDRRLRTSIPSADEVLTRIRQRAHVDITPYTREDGTIDVGQLSADGLGHLVTGSKPGRNGPEVTLTDPQTATKTLARYHRILDRHVDVDLTTTQSIDPDDLASLAAQIAAAQQSIANGDDE